MSKQTISTKIDELKALETRRATLLERRRELQQERGELLSKTESAAQAVGEDAELERSVLHDQLAKVKKKMAEADSQADHAEEAVKAAKAELKRLRIEYIEGLEAALLKDKRFVEVRSNLATIGAHWSAINEGWFDVDEWLARLLDIDYSDNDRNVAQAKKDLLIG